METNRYEVENYLKEVKQKIKEGKFIVPNRKKNMQLHRNYFLSDKDIKDVLLSLNVEDFSKAVQNEHEAYQDEVLYIFGKEISLISKINDFKMLVPIYIKMNYLKKKMVIVISFHPQEFPLKYQFKEEK